MIQLTLYDWKILAALSLAEAFIGMGLIFYYWYKTRKEQDDHRVGG